MAMPQIDWGSVKSFVQIPLSWFKEISRRSNLFSKHPLIVIDRNNPDGVGIGIDPTQLPKGGGGGGGGGVASFAYDPKTRVVAGGVYALSRYFYFADSKEISAQFTGYVVLKIDHTRFAYPTATIEETQTSPFYWQQKDDDITIVPLYQFENGEMTDDWRCAIFVPLWES